MVQSTLAPSSTRLFPSPKLDAFARPPSPGFFDDLFNGPTPQLPGLHPGTYQFFLNPWTPFVFGLAYFAIIKVCSHYNDGKNRIQGKRWSAVVVLHNALLAGYSGWTFASTGPNFFGAFWHAWSEGGLPGLAHVFCDSDAAVWTTTQFPYLCFAFYLSKFWEILDSVILLLKGKKVPILQSYHHLGAIWTMWAGFRSAAMPIWIFVVFNSFIHTLMYMYYALAAMKIPFPQFLKRSLTRLQITQFLVGGSLAASYLFIQLPSLPSMPSAASLDHFSKLHFGELSLESLERIGGQCLATTGQRAAVYLNVFYLVPLTYLFVAFFVSSYRRKNKQATTRSKAVKSE